MCVNQKPVDGSADEAQEQQQTCHGPSYRPRSLSRIERLRFQPGGKAEPFPTKASPIDGRDACWASVQPVELGSSPLGQDDG